MEHLAFEILGLKDDYDRKGKVTQVDKKDVRVQSSYI